MTDNLQKTEGNAAFAPKPLTALRRLGMRLASLLDEDQWAECEQLLLTVSEEHKAMAAAIHYPECWDTAAYPTLEDAMAEIYAWFKCSNDDREHRTHNA